MLTNAGQSSVVSVDAASHPTDLHTAKPRRMIRRCLHSDDPMVDDSEILGAQRLLLVLGRWELLKKSITSTVPEGLL